MNIALTAIGSMSSEAVISSIRNNNKNSVIGFDIYPKEWIATSKLVNSFYKVPSAKDKEYISTILKLCSLNKIEYLIPLTDNEVDVLSPQRQLFERNGITLCLPHQNSISIARDKLKTFNYFKNNNRILVVPTFENINDIDAKKYNNIIAKPRKGRSSEGIIKSNDIKKLKYHFSKSNNYIFQPIIEGTFITVDTIRDIFDNKMSISRKELIRTMNGAGIVVEIFKDKKLDSIVNCITKSLDIIGSINIEFILKKDKYFLMEINPRFSAGIGYSIISGYDFVKNHLKCFQRIPIDTEISYDLKILSKRYIDIINN